ncbi:MAG TPA: VWA domain-containing protein [Pyrinomonadaceae bacterium]|nr:VWA domain-containing protein [Pyrinomonadaceae bacterium]
MRTIMFFLLLFIGSGFSVNSRAQDKNSSDADDEVLRVDTRLIDVPVVATDKTGKPLLNLKQSNFIVYEDGKRQEVADFAAASAPFEVALLLDTSGSARSDLPLIKRAAENFIAALRPGDKVSIVAFRSIVRDNKSIAVSEVLTALTDNRGRLKDALGAVKTSNGTPYYDGLAAVAEKVFGEPAKDEFRGRRALVALTDGVDSTSLSDFAEARENFNRQGIVSYFIQVDTREFFEENLLGDCEGAMRFSQAQIRRYYRMFDPKARVEKVSGFCQLGDFERLDVSKRLYELANAEMQNMAKNSGGKVFPVADLSEARTAFQSVAREIGTKYSLGYYSSNEKRDGTYRKIKIELKGIPPGAQIRAREGYTAPVN